MSTLSSWTDDRVQLLSTLWSEGLSASQIARRLTGGVTRNAVIGKVHRLGLAGRAAPSRPATRRPKRLTRAPRVRTAPARRLASITPAPSPEPAQEGPGTATVLSVGRHDCRWPIGDPLAASFSLCGRPASRGAYCACHGALAYRQTDKAHLLKLAGLR